MNFFKELNLPYPLANSNVLEEIYGKKMSPDLWNYYTVGFTDDNDIQRFLNPQLMSKFQSVGVTPRCLVAIDRNPVGISYIHRDVTFANDQWVKAAFTINWELTHGDTAWHWYDTTGVPEDPLPSTDLAPPDSFRGVHCRPGGTKDPEGFQLLDTYHTKVNQATMYRIDLAHQVIYNTGTTSRRRNIGIRFSINDISTWQQALEIFQVFST